MKVYSTLLRQKEEFVPAGDVVKMYVCGVTTYADCHIGHAMSYIVFDVIRRYLEFRGYQVKYVQNFTDVDDKIIARANQLGISPKQLAERCIAQYFADMDALNIKRADIYPRVTEEIGSIIDVVEGLIKKGHAYQVDGNVYFRIKSKSDYGKLSHRNLGELMSGARVEVEVNKEHPMDFALWKAAKPGEPQWESPWGKGRPGWHIECSAMSLKYLGETLDIHGGGEDLIFPHHENEIAQSESFTGVTPFARYWLHNGLVKLGEDKMSKSLGNLITIKEALARCSPDALRLFVLSSHYRSPVTYTEEALEAMERGIDRLRRAARGEKQGEVGEKRVGIAPEPYRQRFIEAMDDDFSTAQACATLFELAREINRGQEEGSQVMEAQKSLIELAGVLGLTLEEKKMVIPEVASAIDKTIIFRNNLRAGKQWQRADKIRSILMEEGVQLEDTPKETLKRYLRGWIEAKNIYNKLSKEIVSFEGGKRPSKVMGDTPEFKELLEAWNRAEEAQRKYWQARQRYIETG